MRLSCSFEISSIATTTLSGAEKPHSTLESRILRFSRLEPRCSREERDREERDIL